MKNIRLNEKAWELAENMLEKAQELKMEVKRINNATVIDAGIKVKGSWELGRLVTLLCLGGIGKVDFPPKPDEMPGIGMINVSLDEVPSISTLGAQFAGWRISRKYEGKTKTGEIKTKKYFAMASGPARALSLEPKELYEKMEYSEQSQKAIILLETNKFPPESVLEYITRKCNVELDNLLVICAPTNCLVGSIQISGRVVETAIHKITEVGLSPKKIVSGDGTAPIAPIVDDAGRAMGITNDCILYGADVHLEVKDIKDPELEEMVNNTPSSASKDYGSPFYEVFKNANFDFYEIDPHLFAPAKIRVTNKDSGCTFEAGQINIEVLKRAFSV
ncbi:MAG: methenyltetrahydromethanopterin cyclohydrolase [Promethearchaeota archaeon]